VGIQGVQRGLIAFVNTERSSSAAWTTAYTEFPFKYMPEFRAYEREARLALRGLLGTKAATSAKPALGK
jgi:hypothetical protein